MSSRYSKVSLKAMTDSSLLRMLIQISRERDATFGEAANVVYEVLRRLNKAETLYKKLEEEGCACPCPDHRTPDPQDPRGP